MTIVSKLWKKYWLKIEHLKKNSFEKSGSQYKQHLDLHHHLLEAIAHVTITIGIFFKRTQKSAMRTKKVIQRRHRVKIYLAIVMSVIPTYIIVNILLNLNVCESYTWKAGAN